MSRIPKDLSPDSTIAFMRDPYRFIFKRCRRYGTNLFESRILMRPTLCMSGAEMAELFYDTSRFQRGGASPDRIQKTLFGKGGVQGLDDKAHRHRRQLFLDLTSPESSSHMVEITAQCWREWMRQWERRDEVVLYDELCELLTVAVCQWAGVPLAHAERRRRAHELTALFDAAGAIGPRHWMARLARQRANRWMEGFISRIRSGDEHPPEGSAAHSVAWHRDIDGALLSPHVAAVELLNILRPTVAVSVYITFCGLALYDHPECCDRIRAGDNRYVDWFVEEVRRFYPFFPSVAAVVRRELDWQGYRFPRGRRVMLDLYGTNHDRRVWDDPDTFRPERFAVGAESSFGFIPQGGGDRQSSHRCPGEPISKGLMKLALSFLTEEMAYSLPDQDLQIQWSRLPALPSSRFVIRVGRPR